MKILIADQFSDLGGAQRVLLDLLPAMQSQGWDCVLAAPGRGPLCSRAEAMGVRCEEITCGPFGNGSKSFGDLLRFGAQFPELRGQLQRLLDKYHPDLLYLNAPRLVPAACSLGRQAPPVLFHVHNYLQGYTASLTGRMLRHARAPVIANCQFVLEPLRQYLDGAMAEVIYNGVEDHGRSVPRPATGRIGVIGRFCPEKGQDVFVQAARLAAAALPQATFVICGASQFSDEKAQSYERALRESAAGLSVEFTGWREDVGNVLRGLDLLVVPSLPFAEATTRVIPEAYSAGVPVLASDLPGIREILRDGETGFLFQAGKAEALAERICEISKLSAEARGAVTRRARHQFEERFSIEGYRRRVIQSLERVGAKALA